MSKSRAYKLHNRMTKIMKWTVAAEDALTREDAQKALRKVAKHSTKLAKLQEKPYIEDVPKEDSTDDQPSTDR